MATGITKRHSRRCRSRDGERCNCEPTYEAWVFSKRDVKKISKKFPREAEAKSWRADMLSAASRGGLRAPRPTTLEQAWLDWEAGAAAGTIRNRSGDPFKPSALRAYRGAMRNRLLPAFGSVRLAELRRSDLQEFSDRLLAEGLSPSSIGTTLLPLRAIVRRAMSRDQLAANPCAGLHLPAVRGRRERYASPEEAARLIGAAPERDQGIWATAMYAGLRLGELRALRARDVDLASGVIRVERGWDPVEGAIELKTRSGRRRVPVAAVLRDHLTDHRLRVERREDELMFGNTEARPFTGNMLQRRADLAWTAAEIKRITPHECRHTFASLMIAAGVNAKALSTFMGHAKIGITLDRYGHLMPGSEDEAAALLDAYVTAQHERAVESARAAAPQLRPSEPQLQP